MKFHIILLIGILVLFSTPATLAKMPKNQYACHVLTESLINGIVLVQSDTLKGATDMALVAKAITSTKNNAKPNEVLECIVRPTGKFSDSNVEKFYRSIPM